MPLITSKDKADLCEFKVSLTDIVNFRTARVTCHIYMTGVGIGVEGLNWLAVCNDFLVERKN